MSQIKGSPATGLWGATLGFFVGFAAVALFGPTAKRFQEVMDLSPLLVGFLVATPALSGSLLRIPFAAWVDSSGGRKPFLVLLVLSLVGMVGLLAVVWGLYPDNLSASLYPLLVFLGILCGCGIATFSVGIGQVSYWYPQEGQGKALGIFGGIGNIAPGIFSFILPVALATLGLAGSYLAWTLFLAAGVILYFLMGRNAWYFQLRRQGQSVEQAKESAREAGQQLFPAGTPLKSLKVASLRWKTWVLVGLYFTTFGGFIALTAWFPTYWESFFATSAAVAGALTGVYSVLTSLTRVGGGYLADWLGGERTVIGSLALTLAASLVLTFSGTYGLSIAAVVVLALGMGAANAAVFKLVPQEVPDAVGGAAGWVGGLGAFGGFAIPPVMGLIVAAMGSDGYARGFGVFSGLAAMSIALALVLTCTRSPQATMRSTASPEAA